MLITKDNLPVINYEFIDAELLTDADNDIAVECPADHIPASIENALDRISIIRIPFADTSDGRGFSIARILRERGYDGKLRASGRVISDQYRFAIECGFDEIEVDEDIALRQPARLWRHHPKISYRDKLSQPAE